MAQNIGLVYKLVWYDYDGGRHTDYFVNTRNPNWNSYDVSYVHKWDDPDYGIRNYLSHLPLLNVEITQYIQEI